MRDGPTLTIDLLFLVISDLFSLQQPRFVLFSCILIHSHCLLTSTHIPNFILRNQKMFSFFCSYVLDQLKNCPSLKDDSTLHIFCWIFKRRVEKNPHLYNLDQTHLEHDHAHIYDIIQSQLLYYFINSTMSILIIIILL